MTATDAAKRVRYRVTQFVGGATARVDAAELVHARALLTANAYRLFAAMPVDAQRHSLNVLHALEQQGAAHGDLAAAALLHDVGKLAADASGAPIRLWLRGPFVLAEALAPALLRRFALRDPQRKYRFAAWVYREHPTIGAFWAYDAGCSQRTCLLIALHQSALPAHAPENEFTSQLRALQAADGSA